MNFEKEERGIMAEVDRDIECIILLELEGIITRTRTSLRYEYEYTTRTLLQRSIQVRSYE